jgi:hypothetical protein
MTPVFLGRLELPRLGLCVVVGFVVMCPAAEAAVRLCRPAVSGSVGEAKTEQEAKRFAIASWAARASQYGVAYTSWRMANNKRLACKAGGSGSVRCQATANPCVIAQNPRLRPPKPQRGNSQGIEI